MYVDVRGVMIAAEGESEIRIGVLDVVFQDFSDDIWRNNGVWTNGGHAGLRRGKILHHRGL